MLLENSSKLNSVLDKVIIAGGFIFALASLTSKGASSVGVGLAVLFWLIRIAITKGYQFKKIAVNKSIILFLLALIISGLDVWNYQVLDSLDKIILNILFFYSIVNTVDSLDIIKKLSYTVLFSMLVSVGYGFYQKYALGAIRVNGFSFSLSYGLFLAMFLIFAIVYLFWGKFDIIKKIGLSFLSAGMFMNFLFTKARGAWLAFIAGVFILFFVKDKRFIIVLVIFLLISPLFLSGDIISRFESSFDISNHSSNLTRLALWRTSLRMFKDNPINGVGLGNYRDEIKNNYYSYEEKTKKIQDIRKFDHAHNNFFQYIAEAGFLGFMAFVFLQFSILKSIYSSYKSTTGAWSLFLLASFASLIIFNVQGLTEFSFGDTEPLRLFWFLIALNMIIINKLKFEEEIC